MAHPKVLIISFLLLAYFIYSGFVYTVGTENPSPLKMTEKAIRGKLLWQEKNCTACHQLYGLGGYMGPDLTNVMSKKGKGENYVNAVMKFGMGAMPNFELNNDELIAIMEYLKYVDATGQSPAKNFQLTWLGTFETGQGNIEKLNAK